MSRAEPVFMRIAIDKILPGNNIRLEGDVGALAASIRKHGMLQPITVAHHRDGRHVECIFGHRRLAAARAAGLKTVPCLVRAPDSKEVRVLTQLAENRDRRDMTKLEEALVYGQLRKLGMTQARIAEAVGSHPTQVAQRLILLEYPDCVKNAVHRKAIGITDALSIPLELAHATDGRTLTAICRRGGSNVRSWVRRQLAAQDGESQMKKRARYETFNLDSDLIDEIRAAAEAADLKVVEWIRRAVRTALDAQATTPA